MPPTSEPARATIAAPPTRPSTSYRDSTLAIVALLLALRLVNALTLRTFFQPDEFFQSLEPAWQLAFGETSNAWITWEWTTQLRSSLHPGLFALVYRITAALAECCGLTLPAKAELLVAAPKVTQAVFAALLDCYTWKLAEKAYGRGSRTALAALVLSVCSPWQWFCSTRTLSNCLETTLTSIAVFYWPWHWQPAPTERHAKAQDEQQMEGQRLGPNSEYVRTSNGVPFEGRAESGSWSCRLRLSLLLAALACVLRPTNTLIWLAVAAPTLWQAPVRLRHVLVREILSCGFVVLACSVASDKLYYRVWTLPPLRFLYFNIAQSLAVFYGKNRRDYYFTEGLPLLLTTALPFAGIGLYRVLRSNLVLHSPITGNPSIKPAPEVIRDGTTIRMLKTLAWSCIFVTFALSLISHKEVRFLYPILPFLHVLAAAPLSNIFPSNSSYSRKALLIILVATNIVIGGFLSQAHQHGVIDVLHHLRHKHESRNALGSLTSSHTQPILNTTVGFLMPCHSTPWRSHLVYPEISAWALTCEPPLNVPLAERASYLDEADEFYITPGPTRWLRDNMESLDTIVSTGSRSGRHWMRQDPKFKAKYRRAWPQNLVFFEQLEGTLREVLGGTRYRECWRGKNSFFHDDWRRKGDVIVWCFEGE